MQAAEEFDARALQRLLQLGERDVGGIVEIGLGGFGDERPASARNSVAKKRKNLRRPTSSRRA
jgi:hypothetical protein